MEEKEQKSFCHAATMDKKPAGPINEKDREIEIKSNWAHLLDKTPICQVLTLSDVVQVGAIGAAEVDKYDAFYIKSLFSEQEAKKLLKEAESHGFGVTNYPKHYRGNLRLTTTDQALTDQIWARVQPLVPAVVKTPNGEVWNAVGLNECWRLAKYYPGDQFLGHCDAAFQRNSTERSLYTVNIYMNQEYKGGRTRFYNAKDNRTVDFQVVGQTGCAVLFRQPPGEMYYHDGEKILEGVKYLFRTDVMYRKEATQKK